MEGLLCMAGEKEIEICISKHVTVKKGNYLFLWDLQSTVVVASNKSKLDVHSLKANWGHADEKFSPFLIPPPFFTHPCDLFTTAGEKIWGTCFFHFFQIVILSSFLVEW